MTQSYVNRLETAALEVEYFWPVEEGAAVTAFTATIEGRQLVSKVTNQLINQLIQL